MNSWDRITLDRIKPKQEPVVSDGKTVLVHYIGKIEEGIVFDSSMDRAPLELTIGKGNTIPGFVKGITGMRLGEKKSFTVSPEDGYGPKREDLILRITREDFPPNIVPDIGQILQLKNGDGGFINVIVIDIEDNAITLDANHPLAGETLLFDVEVVGIR